MILFPLVLTAILASLLFLFFNQFFFFFLKVLHGNTSLFVCNPIMEFHNLSVFFLCTLCSKSALYSLCYFRLIKLD